MAGAVQFGRAWIALSTVLNSLTNQTPFQIDIFLMTPYRFGMGRFHIERYHMQNNCIPTWLNEAINLARHVPDTWVQLGVAVYDLVCKCIEESDDAHS